MRMKDQLMLEDKLMEDIKNISISFVFVFILGLPVLFVLYETFGLIALALVGVIPIGWFILDSEISHYEMDKDLYKLENH